MLNENQSDHFLGEVLINWKTPSKPLKKNLVGSYSKLEPLNPVIHANNLFELYRTDDSGWKYLPYGPFDKYEEFYEWLSKMANANDPLMYAILDIKTNHPIGVAGYLQIVPEHGSIEVGHLHFSNQLKKTPAATEAMYLMMDYAFELGYRRYEWKCNSLNQPSRNAAERLGFKFEGIFRQHMVYKGLNRDTAWFSIIDSEWPVLKSKFEKWLNKNNFDVNGNQMISLKQIK